MKQFNIIEVMFHGTPAQFYAVAASYESRCRVENRRTSIFTWECPPSDTVKVDISFGGGGLEARCLPQNKSLITILIPIDSRLLREEWDDFYKVLIKEGWVETNTIDTSQKKALGRPSYKANDWAYQQVHIQGNKPADIYNEWEDRLRSEMPPEQFDMLADPKDSFSKAIRQKEKKKK